MRTVTLKTTDLTDCEIGKFLGAFREVYNQERSITYLKRIYFYLFRAFFSYAII